MMRKNVKNVCILVAICSVMAVLLALTNQITAPIIEKNSAAAANEALLQVMPEGTDFEPVDLSGYTLPATVTEAYKETSGKGYVIKLTTKGFGTDMVIMCGVTADGIITGAKCLSSNETLGYEKTYGDNFKKKDAAAVDAVETVGGATMTTSAYKAAVKDALNAALILGGAEVDVRTPEQILADNLDAALPAGEGKFTKVFLTEVVDADAVYAADNGAGYVCVIGEDFYGVDADGNGDNAVAAAAAEAIKNSVSEDVTASFGETMTALQANTTDRTQIAAYRNLQKNITSVQKTASGNYVLEVKGEGYGIKGEYHTSGEPIVIRVSITPDGKIIDCLTLSQSESKNVGDVCATEDFVSRFDGKTEAELDAVDSVAGATVTFTGYKEALKRCLTAVTILEGGAE